MLEAIEMRFRKNMRRIGLINRRTIEEELRTVEEKRALLDTLKKNDRKNFEV